MIWPVVRERVVVTLSPDSNLDSVGERVYMVRGRLTICGRKSHEWKLPGSPVWNQASNMERENQLDPLFRALRAVQSGKDLQIMLRINTEPSLSIVMETASAIISEGIISKGDFQFVLYPAVYGFDPSRGTQLVKKLFRLYGYGEKQFVRFESTRKVDLDAQTGRFES